MDKADSKVWKILEERELYDASPFIRLSAQTVELPDGRRVDNYYQLKMPDIASIYAESEDGRIILLRSYRHGIRRVCLSFPGGHIDPGEPPPEAAQRELLEETGFEGQGWSLLGSYLSNGNHRCQAYHFFKASGCRPVQAPNSGDLEDSEIVLLTRDELRASFTRGDLPFASQLALWTLAHDPALGSRLLG